MQDVRSGDLLRAVDSLRRWRLPEPLTDLIAATDLADAAIAAAQGVLTDSDDSDMDDERRALSSAIERVLGPLSADAAAIQHLPAGTRRRGSSPPSRERLEALTVPWSLIDLAAGSGRDEAVAAAQQALEAVVVTPE